jgi:hypothetical protein
LTELPASDFDADEHALVAQLLHERYGHAVDLQDAETELRLDPGSSDLAPCPALYWCERGAHFVVNKLAPGHYRCEFFYDDGTHFGTGIERFENLRRCVLTLLRVQADHERDRSGAPG